MGTLLRPVCAATMLGIASIHHVLRTRHTSEGLGNVEPFDTRPPRKCFDSCEGMPCPGGFIRPEHRQLTVVAEQPALLLEALARHQPPLAPPWLQPREA
jgi:hypothetical protein